MGSGSETELKNISPKPLKINSEGLAIIKASEGFYPKPYLCPAGVPTIGYGTTIYPNKTKVTLDDSEITLQQGEHYLAYECKAVEDQIKSVVLAPLTINQFSALVSFVYNVGIGNFRASTMLRLINNKEYEAASNEFPKWRLAGGQIMQGLVIRRENERQLFIKK